VAYILESCDEESNNAGEKGRKTFIGRIGGQALMISEKRGENDKGNMEVHYGARRQEWTGTAWTSKYEAGSFLSGIPSFEKIEAGIGGFDGEERWKKGDMVEILGKKYTVRGCEKLVGGQ
jgi:hypothetical protein